MKTFSMLTMLLFVFALANPGLARTRSVNCNNSDETIAGVLARSDPGDIIRIRGTCREQVVITTDRLTLEGRNNAVIDGENVDLVGVPALWIIDAAQGIVITGELTVQNSAAIGISVVNNAQAFFRGNIVSQHNASHGIIAFSGGSVLFDTETVNTMDNGGDGLAVANGANAYLNLAPFDAFMVTSERNLHGIHVANGGSMQMLGGTLRAAENRAHGLRVAYGANLFITGLGKVYLQDNHLQGLNIESNAQALVRKSPRITEKTVTITGNAMAGVSVQAGFIDLREAEITANGSMDNGFDVDLGFGTRAHLTGNTIDTLNCDMTVLLSPATDVACPAP